jgi:anti-sigma regulatory factor (Ser/Thr protein kinase)
VNATIVFPYVEQHDLIIYKHAPEEPGALSEFRAWPSGETLETFTLPREKTCLSQCMRDRFLNGYERLLASMGCEPRRAYDVALTVTEAVANALKQQGPVVWSHHIVARESLDTLHVLLHTPESEPFNPRTLATYDPLREENLLVNHGRGFLIMREYADTLAYSADGRETILEFNLPKTEKAINPVSESYVA